MLTLKALTYELRLYIETQLILVQRLLSTVRRQTSSKWFYQA